ncbi:MAG: hypothetical protein IKT14_06745 [Clostridiales bacterium]|nr:hypothetical protein [Clostridiales bacterium]MBR6484702.1 hypothetical protein [Clostridiales bacterium]
MNKFKIRMALLSFVSIFFFRLGIFLLLGIVLMVIGIQVRTCFAVGIALVAFDFIASVIETVKMFRIIKMGGHPVIEQVNDAINSEDPYGAMDKVMENRSGDVDVAAGKMACVILKDWTKNDRVTSECVDKFEKMCGEYIAGEKKILEYGPVKDSSSYSFCLMRQYPLADGTQMRIFMALVFKASEEFSSLRGSFSSDELDEEFFSHVRSTEIYSILSSREFTSRQIGFE